MNIIPKYYSINILTFHPYLGISLTLRNEMKKKIEKTVCGVHVRSPWDLASGWIEYDETNWSRLTKYHTRITQFESTILHFPYISLLSSWLRKCLNKKPAISLGQTFHSLSHQHTNTFINGGLVQYLLNAKDRKLKKRYKVREDDEEVQNYWMTLWKREDTGNWKRKH